MNISNLTKDPMGGDGDVFRGKTIKAALAGMRMTPNVDSRQKLDAMIKQNDWDCWLPNGIGLSSGDGCFSVSPSNLSRRVCEKIQSHIQCLPKRRPSQAAFSHTTIQAKRNMFTSSRFKF